MSGLSEAETVAVIERLRALLGQEEARLPLNQVATQAVLKRQPRRGAQLRRDQLRDRQRLQRCLSRYLGGKPPHKIPEKSFALLVRQMDRYRSGWGEELQTARTEAAKRKEWEDFETLKHWFRVTSNDEFSALTEDKAPGTESGYELPWWVAHELLGPTGRGKARRGLLLDLLRAGIPDKVAMEVVLRILSPFCGHARSGGQLLRWQELTVPALRRALHASIEAERIWLGLTVPRLKGTSTTARGVTPLKARLPNPLRGSPGLLAGFAP